LRSANMAKDLEFPAEVSTLSFFSAPRLALYRPEGPGPFPALVLLHQCGGLTSANGRWQNMSMLGWAREAVARGYVALLVDSLGPRGADTVCFGPKNGVNFARGVRDSLQAAEHLRKLDFVDNKRVALAGFSWGAMVGVLASSRLWGASLNNGQRFDAVVSLYPGCFTIRPPGGSPYEIVRDDIDRPLLVLMGDKDNETPAEECLPRLEQSKAAGAPVEWHLYPGMTHCWDCENLNGFRKVDFRGATVVYTYDKDITKDAADRMFSFIERSFAMRP
jgi:dienelactone hydrolase